MACGGAAATRVETRGRQILERQCAGCAWSHRARWSEGSVSLRRMAVRANLAQKRALYDAEIDMADEWSWPLSDCLGMLLP